MSCPVTTTLEVESNADAVAVRAAWWIAATARAAIGARGRFVVALSGGRTPWAMLEVLAQTDLPWEAIHVAQVDERVTPPDSPDRNLVHLRTSLLSRVPLCPEHVYAMPVDAEDLSAATAAYARTLELLAGTPPVLDLIHLGLGPDGHTASLVPGDPVLDVADTSVATTGPYRGSRRMTLTYPVLDRARRVLFVITGRDKAHRLAQLLRHDASIPAGRIAAADVVVVADEQAASEV